MLEGLAPNQDKYPGQERQHASDNANPESGESKDSHRNKINRQQKHPDIFCNVHALSIHKCGGAWQS